jgi:hypothetical protein
MLALVFVLGSSIACLLIRESWSETYRCPKCAELHVGRYHRLQCFVRGGGENNTALPVEAQTQGEPQAASQYIVDMRKSDADRDDSHQRFLTFLPGFLAQRAVKGATAALRRHVHLAS